MKWLLIWLLGDVRRLLSPHAPGLSRLRDGMGRARRRHEYHRARARETSERVGQLISRVKALEMSSDADVAELVSARKDLVLAEGDLAHHHARAADAAEALRLMRADRDRMDAGEEARHRDAYREYLDG